MERYKIADTYPQEVTQLASKDGSAKSACVFLIQPYPTVSEIRRPWRMQGAASLGVAFVSPWVTTYTDVPRHKVLCCCECRSLTSWNLWKLGLLLARLLARLLPHRHRSRSSCRTATLPLPRVGLWVCHLRRCTRRRTTASLGRLLASDSKATGLNRSETSCQSLM